VLTPSASHLLVRFTPVERRNFVFSLHQVGIPLGGILAALLAPAVAVLAGWRWSVVLSVALLCAVIVLMQRGRAAGTMTAIQPAPPSRPIRWPGSPPSGDTLRCAG